MSDPLSHTSVAEQLDRILGDPLFRKSQRLSQFLRFGVERVLAGASTELKEYTFGVEVFERSADYSPSVDPIVRIMAGRLRSKLAEYYLSSGVADPILIEVPRGGYVPQFSLRSRAPEPSRISTRRASVGRAVEMARLGRIWDGLTNSGGRLVAISGEAGLGKTTFVEDFLSGVEPSTVIARGHCSERLADTDPFAPLLDALDGLMRLEEREAELLQSIAPSWHAQVCGVPSQPPSHERMRRELAAFFEGLARLRPVILFLEDLHWADASTCDLLVYLGQRLRGAAVLILGTYRPSALVATGHPFVVVRLRLKTLDICDEIPLSLLTRDDVAAYLANNFPENQFPSDFAATLHDRTEGHPLFLTDLLRHLADTTVLASTAGVWRLSCSTAEVRRVIPAGTQAMIGVKLASLDDADREILRCGAVQGMQFDSAIVAAVLAMDAIAVEDRLRALDRVHTLIAATDDDDRQTHRLSSRYRFVHVFYQNALYQSLAPSRRAALSVAVAQALSDGGEHQFRPAATEIAVLYESGRDYANAAQHFLRAARHAAGVFAYPETVLLCQRGLRALATVPPSRTRDEQELLFTLTLGMAMMSSTGYASPEVESTYRRARELCLTLNDVRRLVPVLWAIHTCVTNAGKLAESLEVALEMRRAADALGRKESIVESLHAHGTTLAFMGRLHEAQQVLERIFTIAPVDQHEFRGSLYVIDPLVTSQSMLARLVTLLGDFEAGRRMASESLELAQRLAHPHSLAYARFWIGWILQTGGAHEEALPHLETAMELGRAHDLPLIVEWGRIVRGAALTQLDRRDEGIDEMRKSLRRQDAMGSRLERPYCLTLLAEAILSSGDAAQALALCDEALEIGRATESLDFQPETHRWRAEALRALGHSLSEVRAELDIALRLARSSGCVLLERRIDAGLTALSA